MSSQIHVLCVDDEPAILELVEIYFQNHDLKVALAKNANEAIDLFKKNPIRVVVSDSRMPGLKGVELFHRLRNEFGFSGAFILVSGNFSCQEENNLPEGILLTLAKPVDYDELAIRIKSFLA